MAAIRDDNPVICFEHKMLYGRKGEVGAGDAAIVPIGEAAVPRTGTDVTIVAALAMVDAALAAADELARDGVEAEVIDLRTLRPLDTATIAGSVAKTGRLVVVEEGPPTGGYASDVIALAVEEAGPIQREARGDARPSDPVQRSARGLGPAVGRQGRRRGSQPRRVARHASNHPNRGSRDRALRPIDEVDPGDPGHAQPEARHRALARRPCGGGHGRLLAAAPRLVSFGSTILACL